MQRAGQTRIIKRAGSLSLKLAALIALAGCQSVPPDAAPAAAEPAQAAPSVSRNSSEPPNPSLVTLRWNLLNPEVQSLFFHNMDELFETRLVDRAGEVWAIETASEPLPTYTFGEQQLTYEDFAERTKTNAFLVIRNGQITFEDYRNRTVPGDRFASFSMAKSIVSILVGLAIDRGLIGSVEEPAGLYVPELKGTGYEGVSIRHILQMRSGVDYEERYDFGENPSLAARVHENAIVLNRSRFTDVVTEITNAEPPGAHFNYATMDTAILGRVLEGASGRPIADITREWLWQPAGMEHDGFWIADGPEGIGRELAGMGYNASLRDFGRIGLMMLNGGLADGRRVVSESWVTESTQIVPLEPEGAAAFATGYGYQWWKLDDVPGSYTALGLAGQFIHVHPPSGTVIVKLSYFPVSEDEALLEETIAFFGAITAANMR